MLLPHNFSHISLKTLTCLVILAKYFSQIFAIISNFHLFHKINLFFRNKKKKIEKAVLRKV